MPPYLMTFLSKKTEIDNFEHFRLYDPLKGTLELENEEIAECAFFGIIISWDGVNLWRKFLG